jgi:hypothetical protein
VPEVVPQGQRTCDSTAMVRHRVLPSRWRCWWSGRSSTWRCAVCLSCWCSAGAPGHPQGPRPWQPQVAHQDRLRGPPAWSTPRPAPPGWPSASAGTGRSRRCTTSATPPLPRTPPRCAPDPPRRSCGPGQPGHRRAVPRWAAQPRRRAPVSQPQPLPTPGHPRHQHRMSRTSPKNPPRPCLALRQAGLRRILPNWGRAGPRAGRPEHSRPRARQKPDH